MNRIYKRGSYEIYGYKNTYIVYNKKKPFESGHTHITNFNTAKYLIYLSYTKKIPKHLSIYLYKSLIRISDNNEYKIKINKELNKEIKKKNKSQHW